ncbi:MAG: hypothetical protein K2I29_01145, partial [Clostridia bacterium]|nr:hypothetical protein [Clostridia bacterium]
FLLHALGRGKATQRFLLVSNVVRYTLTLVVAALVIILPIFIEGQSVGLMGVVFAVLTLVALLLNIFRLINAPKKVKKAKSKKEKTVKVEAPVVAVIDDEQPVEEEPIVYVPEKREQPAALANEEPQVYNPVIYNGPVDDFIKTLPTELKVEFSRVFLERQCGNLSFIPDYKVGGNNDRFFNNVFIYFARLRNAVSDELINKMYEFGNLM